MNDRASLLKAIAERPRDGRYGIGTAAQYLKSLSGCFDGGYCPRAMNGVSAEEWAGALKDAESKFVYCEKGMNIDKRSIEDPTLDDYLLEFECTVTSNKKDRDGDVLETRGAVLDPMAPLLWQHDPFHPIGKVLRRTGQTNTKLNARCCILDFGDGDGELAEMARDAAVLVRANALRISHGFDPKDFKPLDTEDSRYLISSFEILEVSLVSIPSNTDAIITAFSNKKLHSALIKGYAEGLYRARPAMVQGADFQNGVFPAVKVVTQEKHDCTCHTKDAAAHQHDSVRHEGESLADCVSRKIDILMNEGGRSQQQCEAIAYSMCGEKAMVDLGISRESLTPKENVMSTEAKPAAPVETKSPETMTGPANTGVPSTDRMNSETQIPQMAQQGDSEWPGRHPSSMVRDESLVGVDDFDVGNTADDAIMAIAAGPMKGPQQNAAPDKPLSSAPGTAGQSGVPTPTSGVQFPIPMPGIKPVSTSPGPQGSSAEPSLSQSVQGPKDTTPTVKESSVNNAQQVTPLDRDSASAHDTDGNIDTHVIVDVPHLKRAAAMVQHSGKEGAVYLHPENGHVHHVAHPDDLHPDNQHMYHGHDEIQKLYKSVKGVKGVKVAIGQHPTKGMGYKMVHCATRVQGADPGMGDGTERAAVNPMLKRLLNIKGRLEFLFHKCGDLSGEQAKKIIADGYAGLMQFIKDYNIDPVGNGMSATLPAQNALDQHSLGNFTSVPGNNDLNYSSRTGFQGAPCPSPGLPNENALNQPSIDRPASLPNTPASNAPTSGKSTQGFIGTTPDLGVLQVPRTPTQPAGQNVHVDGEAWDRCTDPDMTGSIDQPNVSETVGFGYNVLGVSSNVLNQNNIMDWLTGGADPTTGLPNAGESDAHKEFDELFGKEIEAFEAKEFDEMFAK